MCWVDTQSRSVRHVLADPLSRLLANCGESIMACGMEERQDHLPRCEDCEAQAKRDLDAFRYERQRRRKHVCAT